MIIDTDDGGTINSHHPDRDQDCPHCARNRQQAEYARTALDLRHLRLEPEVRTAMQDLLTDLYHLADVEGLDLAALQRDAYRNYLAEGVGEDDNDKTCRRQP